MDRRLGVWLAAALLPALLAIPAVADAAAPEPGSPLPTGPGVVEALGYVGDQVIASFGPQPNRAGEVYQTPADGSGTWQPVQDPGTSQPVREARIMSARGGAVLVFVSRGTGNACDNYRVIHDDVADVVTSCSTPVLGHGGKLLATDSLGGPWTTERLVEHAVVLTSGSQPAIDGDTVWTRQGDSLVGTDTSTTGTTTVPLPAACSRGGTVETSGRFAIAHCDQDYLVDLTGMLVPWAMPASNWALGNGFAYKQTSDPDAASGSAIAVMDFSDAHTIRYYASAGGATLALPVADDRGGHSLVYLDDAGRVERADLTWLGAPPDPALDRTPPRVLAQPLPPAVKATTSSSSRIPMSWGQPAGQSDATTYDVRLHDSRDPGPYWSQPADLQATRATSFDNDEASGETELCFSVRARDWVGNLSAWTPSRCTIIDNQAPFINGNLLRPFQNHLANAPVTSTFLGEDDDKVASYDASYRLARPGHAWGGWVSPASWQRSPHRSFSVREPAGTEVCTRARARDRAGNVGAYSGVACTGVPYDDRAFGLHGNAHRSKSSSALGGTLTRVIGRGRITLPHVHARAVFVRVLNNRHVGCPRITIGNRAIGNGLCVSYPSGRYLWVGTYAAHVRVGTLGVVDFQGYGLKIDAVSILR